MSSPKSVAPSRPPASPQVGPHCVSRATFSDADELSAVLRHGNIEAQVARGGRYCGQLVQLETADVGVQWGSHETPMLTRGAILGEGVLMTRWGASGPVCCNGEQIGSGAVFYPSGSEHQSRSGGAMGFAAISVADLESMAAALAPDLLFPSRGGMLHVESAPAEVQALQGLLGQVRRAIEGSPGLLRDPAAGRGLRESLGAAMVRVLVANRPLRQRESGMASSLVRRVEEHMRACGFQPVFLSELCAVGEVSEVQLRQAFLKVYGVGPVRYLRLRRLHQVRLALRTAAPTALTVSAAAARFGFFEFGRFAGDYRAVFGELPSQTLRLH